MKAKEYADKYIPLLVNCTTEEERKDVISDLFIEFMKDIEELKKLRHINDTSTSLISLLNEGSQKWKTLCRLLPNKELNEHGFKNFWVSKIPELEKHLY